MAENNFFGVKKGLRFKPSTLPVSGNLGEITYDSATNKFKQWNGLNWADITGSGGGGINYIDNPMAEDGLSTWATYADAAASLPVDGIGGVANITFTRSAASPLRDTGSFLFTKDAANRQGQGTSYDLAIDDADKGKVLTFSMDYNISSGTYADDDLICYIYDVTNAALIEPVPFKIKNHLLPSERFYFQFQTNLTSNNYRFILHVASTSTLAFTIKMDNMILGPNPRTVVNTYDTEYINTASALVTTNTLAVAADNFVDVTNAVLNLTEPGEYEIIYNGHISVFSSTSPAQNVFASLEITDSSNNVLDGARMISGDTINSNGTGNLTPVYLVSRVTVTTPLTVKLRLRCNSTPPNQYAETGSNNYTASFSGDDTSCRFYAKRIVTNQTQVKDDGYAARLISFKTGKETAQSIPDGTWTKVTGWATPNHDTVGGFLNDTYTVKSAGIYEVQAQITFSTNASGRRNTLIRKNNENLATPRATSTFPGSASPAEASAPVASTDWYNVGDTIDIFVLQTSGTALTVSTSGGYNLFSVKKIPNPSQVIEPLIEEYTEADKIKNYVINGNFELWQRSDAFKLLGGVQEYHADRFRWAAGTITGIVKSEKMPISTFSNSTMLPKSCQYMQRYEVTTAQAVLGAGATAGPWYKMEGYDFAQMLQQGALQRGFTLSFYVGATVGGTYTIELFNSANDRKYFKTYTIVGGNTWQRINMHFTAQEVADGISSGIWNYTTLSGIGFRFWLAAGTSSNGGVQNAWTGAANVPVTQVNFLSTFGNWWGITGLMVNTGKIVTDFRTRGDGFAEELRLAQRYYEKTYPFSIDIGGVTTNQLLYISNTSTGAASPVGTWFYKTAKRASPSFTFYNHALVNTTGSWRTTGGVDTTMSLVNNYENYASYQPSIGIAAGVAITGHATAESEI